MLGYDTIKSHIARYWAFWLVVLLVLTQTCNQIVLYKTVPYNSDDYAGVYILQFFSSHNLPLNLPSDTFFLKAPFNLIGEVLLGHTRGAIFLSTWLANVLNITLVVYAIKKILALLLPGKPDKVLVALVAVAFIALPSFVFQYSLRGANNRTFEIGASLFMLYFILRFWADNKLSWRKITAISLVAAVFMYNDPEFIVFFVAPVALVSFYIYTQSRRNVFLATFIATIASFVVYKIMYIALRGFGINPYPNIIKIVDLPSIPGLFPLTTKALLALFNADIFGQLLNSPETLVHGLYLVVLILLLVASIRVFKSRDEKAMSLVMGLWLPLAVYFLTDIESDLYSARYLISTPFIAVPIVVLYLQGLKLPKKQLAMWLLAVVSLVNLGLPWIRLTKLFVVPRTIPNSISLHQRVAQVIQEDYRDAKGYGSYWFANGTNFYLRTKHPVEPVVCSGNSMRVQHWVNYDGANNSRGGKSYVIVGSETFTADITTVFPGDICDSKQVVSVLGQPVSRESIGSSTYIFGYDYDVSKRFIARPDPASP